MLNEKQKRFCTEYLVDFNATQAAKRAGYSKQTARAIGSRLLTNVDIKQYIAEKVKDCSVLGPGEAIKLISDIATSSLNDYFTEKMIEHTPRVLKGLKTLIKDLQIEIAYQKEFLSISKLKGEEKKGHDAEIKQKELQIIRYQIELKYNPKASRIVDGQPVFVKTVELDMVKLVADKERGRIKSLSYSPSGQPKVEMYSADSALRDMAKIHNLFKDEDEKKTLSISINGKGVKIK
jgi:phage terminase small subunit